MKRNPTRPIDWTSVIIAVTPFLGLAGSLIFVGIMVLR